MSFFKQQIKINNKTIGGERVYIIAEMACAHDGEFNKAIKLIDCAADAKADAIQFELLEPDANVIPGRDINKLLKSLYFTPNEWKKLFKYARKKKLDIFSFAYDLPSLKLALKLKTDAIKLNSSDLMNTDLLKLASKSKLPFSVGTGGSTFEEIAKAVAYIKKHNGKKCILMHGVQNFPTKLEYLRINRVKILKESFKTIVGYADHTDADTDISKIIDLTALGMGAKVLEKHITLDRDEKGVDYQSALEPDEFKQYVKLIRDAQIAMGNEELTPLIAADYEYRIFQKKSIVAKYNIKKGQKITKDKITFLRDTKEVGILPIDFKSIKNKRAKKDIKKFELIKSNILED